MKSLARRLLQTSRNARPTSDDDSNTAAAVSSASPARPARPAPPPRVARRLSGDDDGSSSGDLATSRCAVVLSCYDTHLAHCVDPSDRSSLAGDEDSDSFLGHMSRSFGDVRVGVLAKDNVDAPRVTPVKRVEPGTTDTIRLDHASCLDLSSIFHWRRTTTSSSTFDEEDKSSPVQSWPISMTEQDVWNARLFWRQQFERKGECVEKCLDAEAYAETKESKEKSPAAEAEAEAEPATQTSANGEAIAHASRFDKVQRIDRRLVSTVRWGECGDGDPFPPQHQRRRVRPRDRERARKPFAEIIFCKHAAPTTATAAATTTLRIIFRLHRDVRSVTSLLDFFTLFELVIASARQAGGAPVHELILPSSPAAAARAASGAPPPPPPPVPPELLESAFSIVFDLSHFTENFLNNEFREALRAFLQYRKPFLETIVRDVAVVRPRKWFIRKIMNFFLRVFPPKRTLYYADTLQELLD